MKKSLIAVLLLISTNAFAAKVVKRGAPLSDAKPVALETVMKSPDDYVSKPVLVEGVVEQACTRKGCWMQITSEPGKPAMRVTFKDYGFFIPLDSKGMKARAEGVTKIKTLSKEEADHLSGEGATLSRSADGTAREVSFEAAGVELQKP